MEETVAYPCPHCGYDPAKCPPLAYALQPGSILNGKYVVGTVLGQGGFGITYIGWDLALGSKVAIKEYFPSAQVSRTQSSQGTLQWYNTEAARTARESGKEMFLKEARKMSRVDNVPQVVRVRDLFQQNETAYIVMDFIEGQTLKAYLKQHGPLGWPEAETIFLPVIYAMARIHQESLIHRDISPDNLMLQANGSVRILDLGAAKDLNVNSGASSMQVAKSGFSPLEQYTQRGGSGTWTDVYALAATMYYSLTGVLPPAAVDLMSGDTLRWDHPRLTAVPKNVLTALQKAMVLQPDKRTQTMMELAHQLTTPVQSRNPGGNGNRTSPGKQSGSGNAFSAADPGSASRENPDTRKNEKQAGSQSARKQQNTPQNTPAEKRKPGNRPLIYILIAFVTAIICFFSFHVWDDATCTEPAKCRICGTTQGSPLGHTWQAATCEKAKTCSRCGQTSGSPLGHNWQAATCEAPKTCKTCGKTEGTASGHQWIAATYESPKRCKICGATQGNVKGYLPTASGHFSEEQVSHGNTSWNSFIFDSPLEGCTKFTFSMTVSNIDKGNPYGIWRIYSRNKWGGWVKIGSITLESASASAEITLDTPTTITEIFIGAPYGWTPGFTASYSITDIYTRADS